MISALAEVGGLWVCSALNDRERVWYEMVEQMMGDINAELDRQIRANMQRFMQL